MALDGEGRIRAYVGGASYADSQFDRATQAQRQAGSAFKPFVYLTAMEAGHTPSEQVVDEPITIGNWSPKNYTGKYLGPITLETALAQSINTVAARLANEVGTDNVAATAHRLGITSQIQTDPSMALGAVEVTPLEMAEAYDAFANGGYRVHAYGIERIRTASGQVLYDHGVDSRQPQSGDRPAGAVGDDRDDAPGGGVRHRRRAPRSRGYDLAGKTGTTSDYRDAWFVGFTGGFVAAVWVGRDDNTPMKRVTGGGAPAEIWRSFMAPVLPHIRRPRRSPAARRPRRPARRDRQPARRRRQRRADARASRSPTRRRSLRGLRRRRARTARARRRAAVLSGAIRRSACSSEPWARSQARWGRGSPISRRTSAQNFGPWLACSRWAHSWAAT